MNFGFKSSGYIYTWWQPKGLGEPFIDTFMILTSNEFIWITCVKAMLSSPLLCTTTHQHPACGDVKTLKSHFYGKPTLLILFWNHWTSLWIVQVQFCYCRTNEVTWTPSGSALKSNAGPCIVLHKSNVTFVTAQQNARINSNPILAFPCAVFIVKYFCKLWTRCNAMQT